MSNISLVEDSDRRPSFFSTTLLELLHFLLGVVPFGLLLESWAAQLLQLYCLALSALYSVVDLRSVILEDLELPQPPQAHLGGKRGSGHGS